MRGNEALTGTIVDTAYKLHVQLGPGLLESIYEAIFARMLEKRGLHVERQYPVTFEFDGERYDEGHRIDLLVNKEVVVELKAQESIHPVHKRQLLTYLRLLKLPVGLLINFGAEKVVDGIHRVLNHHALDTPRPPEAFAPRADATECT